MKAVALALLLTAPLAAQQAPGTLRVITTYVGLDGKTRVDTVTSVVPRDTVIVHDTVTVRVTTTVVVHDTVRVFGPPLVASEPVFNPANSTLVYQDNMDSYVSATAMGAASTGTVIVPNPSPVAVGKPVNVNANQVIMGRGGNGKALRLLFPGLNQSGATYYVINAPRSPNNSTHFFQYWSRVQFATPLQHSFGVKWFLVWHRTHSSSRIQWALHDHLPWSGVSTHGIFWQVYDQAATTSQATQPVGPYLCCGAAGLDTGWHRFTYQYRPNSFIGARDGIARMWIDGVKVIDISREAIGITPPGGEKVWCNLDDLDALVANDDVGQVLWGSTQTNVSPAWTLDVDDFVWWRVP